MTLVAVSETEITSHTWRSRS